MKKKLLLLTLLFLMAVLSSCSNDVYEDAEQTWTMVKENITTYSDGEHIDQWQLDHSKVDFYKLSDETELLIVDNRLGPANCFVSGQESFHDLSKKAQTTVQTFYDEQGLLYDLPLELEKAYEYYLTCKDSEIKFHSYHVEQSTSPTASNDNIMCFITTVMLPIRSQVYDEIRLGAVFSKETGEYINSWDLFSLPKEDVISELLIVAQIEDKNLLEEMKLAFKPEYIVLFPDNLSISFPQGSLPSQEHGYIFGIEYDELEKILYSWAIPN